MSRLSMLYAGGAGALLLLVTASSAGAAPCRDAKGHFTACPAAGAAMAQAGAYSLDAKGNCHDARGKMAKKALCASAPAATSVAGTPAAARTAAPARTAARTTAMSAAAGPNCVKGKRCGNACISVNDVCHK